MPRKIINDPVHGFIDIPDGIIFDLIEHPFFQRLRRIKQTSLTHYVYPGALHTRFHHALGAYHLMTLAIGELRAKGVAITDDEATAVSIAILLHDIGHGPFSHTLEHTLITNVHHEQLSLWFMEYLNDCFDGQLSLAIEIFKGVYKKPFLHQLVSGQLDMDRMDYLSRDSFFTGVHEGVIGYDRIIKMLNVVDGELVVEEKGIYSIEKFLIARRLMYWQVYLHKTVLVSELMLIKTLERVKFLANKGWSFDISAPLNYFLNHKVTAQDFFNTKAMLLKKFAALDDYDIISALKVFSEGEDKLLSFLSKSILNRKLFKLEFNKNDAFSSDYKENIRQKILKSLPFPIADLEYLLIEGQEHNSIYEISEKEINILYKNGTVQPMSKHIEYNIPAEKITKHYLCYPKNLL